MNFRIKNRDGPARIGEILLEDRIVTTPNILFVDTSRIKAPNIADIFITNEKRKKQNQQ